jgi:RNA recognition motif-containing protein
MKIFIGSLDKAVTWHELHKLFSEYGTVNNCDVVVDRFSGESRGFGFVFMPDDTSAEKAIAALNGKVLNGRAMVVQKSRPRVRDIGERI